MQLAKTDIVETNRPNSIKISFSLVEKQNESGFYNNTRLFFCQRGHHIGYLSQTYLNSRPEDINFGAPKTKVLLTNIKSISLTQRDLKIKFGIQKENTFSEKTWFLTFQNEILCKKWYELLQKERTMIQSFEERKIEEVQPPKLQPQPEPVVVEPIQQPQKKPFQLVSRNMEVTEKIKPEKQTREIGTNVSPKNSDPAKSRSKYNYEYQLTKLMNKDPSKFNESNKETLEFDKASKSEVKKENSSPSDSVFKRDPNQSRKKLQISKSSEKSNVSSSNEGLSSRPNKIDIPQSRLIEDEDVSPIQRLNHQKYFEENLIGQSQNEYFQRTNKLIKNSPLEQYFGERYQINSIDDVEALTIKSPTFPAYTQKSKLSIYPSPLKATVVQKNKIPWTFKYIKHNHLMFQQFTKYTEVLFFSLISDLNRPSQSRNYKQKLLKNNIGYYDIDDIEVKIALIQLQNVKIQDKHNQTEKISSKSSIKILQNEFNNYHALYELVGDSLQLRVPLVTICEFQGFVGLFKILSNNLDHMLKTKQLRKEIEDLKAKSKIDCTFNENLNQVIIQLDHNYYDRFKSHQDRGLNFQLYFIQEIDQYLLPDVISDKHQEGLMILRKELIDKYETDRRIRGYGQKVRRHLDFIEEKQNQKELDSLSSTLISTLTETLQQLDSLSIYFINSSELSEYLHSKGINMRYLGHLYSHLKTTFQKRIIMTEIASRSCKLLFRKTIQDIMLDEGPEGVENNMHSKICDFLNCVLGKSFETAEFWKVLSAHSISNFGVDLNPSQIDRWYFIISLIQNCRLIVNWQRIKPEQAFKTDQFFSEGNLQGLSFHHKTYHPYYSQYNKLCTSILDQQESRQGFDQLVNYLNLKHYKIPQHLAKLELKIKKYLAYFISPDKATQNQFSHLGIYQHYDQKPSKLQFDIMLIQTKWYLKIQQKEQYIRSCTQFIRVANKHFGEFHPIFSQLYDLFSAYHLTNSEYEDSITFAKSSLVNVLKICGTNHEKTSEAYYHLSLCYLKADRLQQALMHLQKSKLYFQTSNSTESVAYAIMSLRLGQLYLSQTQVQMSLEVTTNALNILESLQAQHQCQDQITQCYQIMARCYQILMDKSEMQELSLHCFQKLKAINKSTNLEKILKIYLYPILSSQQSKGASSYIDIISLLTQEENQEFYETSFELLKRRIEEGTFADNLKAYLDKIMQIQMHIREKNVMESWQSFKEVYPRETVKDFLALTTELITFLGQGFVVGSLREAL